MRFASSILLAISIVQHAACWGDLGHRTVGYLAQKYLTDSASELFDSILANNQSYDYSDAATFADKVKRQRPYTATWHYVDAQDTPFATPPKCGLKYPADCTHQGPNGCIITAINNQTALFLSPDTSDLVRREALMYLMHFIGDLHQPLHVEDAFRGGNDIEPIRFDNVRTLNLHSVWDSSIPHKMRGLKKSITDAEEKIAAAQWADELFTLNGRSGVDVKAECGDVETPDKCALEWANKSNWWICKFVLSKSEDWFKDLDNDLGEEYFEGAKPVVEELIGLAGARLGAWMNALASEATQRGILGGGQKVPSMEKIDL